MGAESKLTWPNFETMLKMLSPGEWLRGYKIPNYTLEIIVERCQRLTSKGFCKKKIPNGVFHMLYSGKYILISLILNSSEFGAADILPAVWTDKFTEGPLCSQQRQQAPVVQFHCRGNHFSLLVLFFIYSSSDSSNWGMRFYFCCLIDTLELSSYSVM